jgi:hypothetical protein
MHVRMAVWKWGANIKINTRNDKFPCDQTEQPKLNWAKKTKRPFPVIGNGLVENEMVSFSKPFPYAGIAQIRFKGFFSARR